nr:Unknown Function [uncultured bacterium]
MTELSAPQTQLSPPARRKQYRVVWLAGTRGELLLLAPFLQAFKQQLIVDGPIHFLFDTGEHGMAMQQTMDFLKLCADETAPLLHPADEPSVRLQEVLERVEAFTRQRKASHLILTGYGASATAASLLCHTRGSRALWLRPADPAGVIETLELESGYCRIISACGPRVKIADLPILQPQVDLKADQYDLREELPGVRGDAPLALIAVLRREWGMRNDTTSALVRRAAEWARHRPEIDFVFLSNLNARLESPFRSLRERPLNLLIAPPLPYPLYRELLNHAIFMLTDSPLFAADALGTSIPLITLGDTAKLNGITPADLSSDLPIDEWLPRKPTTTNQTFSASALPDIQNLITNFLMAD